MLILHCGLPRTSTSSLQRALHARRTLLVTAGIAYPDRWQERKSAAHHGVVGLLERGAGELDELKSFLADRPDDDVLLSAENLTRALLDEGRREAVAESLGEIGEVTPVRLLWTLRRLDEVLASAHSLTLGLADASAFGLDRHVDDDRLADALFTGMQCLEQVAGAGVAYVGYDPGGSHNGELLRAGGAGEEIVAAVRSEIESTRRLNASFTHKQAVALANLGAIAEGSGVAFDVRAVRGAFARGEFEFAEDWRCRPLSEERARAIHERSLAAARERRFAPYTELFGAERVEFDSPGGLRLELLSDEDLAAFRARLGLAACARRRLGPSPELSDWPAVSVVIVNRNGGDLLPRLLGGLRERTDYPALELIFVDNASGDDSLDAMRDAAASFSVAIVANAHNESFSVACNQGASLATGELLLFLNNDAEPFEAGWLRELVACLHNSGAVAAGPTLIQPTTGSAVDYEVHQRGLWSAGPDGSRVPGYRDRGADVLGEQLGRDVETIALAGACLLVPREAFEEVGGFAARYWYGPEDVDLALRLRERGGYAVCSGRSLLIHPPNSTLDAVESGVRAEWVRGNRRAFAERWAPRVRRECRLDRLRGGGLWVEPVAPDAPPPEYTRAEAEALAFCVETEDVLEPAAEEAVEGLVAELRRRGHRCLVLRGAPAGDPHALGHDVAIHLRGPLRFLPRLGQLNVLWCADAGEEPRGAERVRYDLVLTAPRSAAALVDAIEARAREIGLRTRIDQERASTSSSLRA